MPVTIRLLAEEENSPYSDVLVFFKDSTLSRTLRGRFDGYDIENSGKCKGYLKLPIESKICKLYSKDEIAEFFTPKFTAISRYNVRLIWDILVNEKKFTLEEGEL